MDLLIHREDSGSINCKRPDNILTEFPYWDEMTTSITIPVYILCTRTILV
jgi:hypothetical protein